MRRTVFVGLALAVFGAVVVPAQPAGAVSVGGGGVLVGTGTASPGIPLLPPGVPVNATFSGTLAGTVDATIGSMVCNLQFATQATRIGSIVLWESVPFGAGSWNGGCSGPGMNVGGCAGSYVRVAADMVMTGQCTINGVGGTWTAELAWEPTTTPPVTSFALAGAVVLVTGSI
jgi:hypothetical protein